MVNDDGRFILFKYIFLDRYDTLGRLNAIRKLKEKLFDKTGHMDDKYENNKMPC